MTDKVTVKTIVEKWLKENQFDGLYGDDCGCGIGDLFACGCCEGYCEPAFKSVCTSCGSEIYSANKIIKCQDCQEVE